MIGREDIEVLVYSCRIDCLPLKQLSQWTGSKAERERTKYAPLMNFVRPTTASTGEWNLWRQETSVSRKHVALGEGERHI